MSGRFANVQGRVYEERFFFFLSKRRGLVKDGWIEDKKKGKRKREWKRIALVRVLGDESHRVCNNFVADRSTTERRLFFCRYIYIYLFLLFFFFFHASRIDSPFFHSCEQLEAILAIFVLFCFFFSFPVIGHVSFNTIIESSRERGSSLGTSSPPPFEFRMPRF